MGWRVRPLLLPSLGVAIVMMVVVVARDARRAYKLHTIALTSTIHRAHVSSQDCASTPPIDLFNIAVRPVEERGENKRSVRIDRGRFSRPSQINGEDTRLRVYSIK